MLSSAIVMKRSYCTVQVRQEAQQVFGSAEQEPDREAAESMHYTVACLKVTLFSMHCLSLCLHRADDMFALALYTSNALRLAKGETGGRLLIAAFHA